MIREELSRLFTIGERHRRLFARLVIAFGLSIVVYAVGTVLIWIFESGQKGGNIHGFGDAAFFCAVQLLTVSSSMTNPVTSVGKIIDVGLEAWAIFVVTAVAGSFATFFSSGDASLSAWLRSCRWLGTKMPPRPLRARSAGQRRELTVTPGQPDTPAHLRTGRLTRCANRPSKQVTPSRQPEPVKGACASLVVGCAAPGQNPSAVWFGSYRVRGRGLGQDGARPGCRKQAREMAAGTRASRCHQPGDRGKGEQDR